MSINIKTKGANGEREVAEELNLIIHTVYAKLEMPMLTVPMIQRNQNQSAVGGNDLTNVLGLSIEIKRHETLSIGAWWKQCCKSAERNDEIPVLIFRQNYKAWRVILNTQLTVPDSSKHVIVRSEIDWDTFKYWFYLHVENWILSGKELRV